MNHSHPPRCQCAAQTHTPRFVVLTGGPGGGKTAVLEVARQSFCEHIVILPEAASIIFGGGFWRKESSAARMAAQRAIYHVQRELERLVAEEKQAAIALCDRATIDGLAYWPDTEASYWSDLGTTREIELSRYSAVIHLESPSESQGYNYRNPVRIESPLIAHDLDRKILEAWTGHPKRLIVESSATFLTKAREALGLIFAELPDCCKGHAIRGLDDQSE